MDRREGRWSALLLAWAVALGGAACHELELSQLRCSVEGRCPSGYSCGSDDLCRPQIGGRVAGPPGSKKQGEACGAAGECETKNCVDGV